MNVPQPAAKCRFQSCRSPRHRGDLCCVHYNRIRRMKKREEAGYPAPKPITGRPRPAFPAPPFPPAQPPAPPAPATE